MGLTVLTGLFMEGTLTEFLDLVGYADPRLMSATAAVVHFFKVPVANQDVDQFPHARLRARQPVQFAPEDADVHGLGFHQGDGAVYQVGHVGAYWCRSCPSLGLA